MGHSICAVLLKGEFDGEKAKGFDLRPHPLEQDATLFFIDHYYSAVWQATLGLHGQLESTATHLLFPREVVIGHLLQAVSVDVEPEFAIILTDYSGGAGEQWAETYRGQAKTGPGGTINSCLKRMGFVRKGRLDEFDSLGLADFSRPPDFLEDYEDRADELGV